MEENVEDERGSRATYQMDYRYGEIDANRDRWFDIAGTLSSYGLLVKMLFSHNRHPIEDLINTQLGTHPIEETIVKGITLSKDLSIWSLTSPGSFSLSSAWELVRKRSLTFVIAKNCWNKYMPPKICLYLEADEPCPAYRHGY